MVKRYNFGWTHGFGDPTNGYEVSDTHGNWVSYSDYEKMEIRLAEAKRHIADLLLMEDMLEMPAPTQETSCDKARAFLKESDKY